MRRDSLADELPYWLKLKAGPHLVIPYSYEANDNRFNENSGFSTGEPFFVYMRDAFDCCTMRVQTDHRSYYLSGFMID
jgi:allantoinase